MFLSTRVPFKPATFLNCVGKERKRLNNAFQFSSFPEKEQENTHHKDKVAMTSVRQSSKKRGLLNVPPTRSDSTALVDSLLTYTSTLVDASASNIVAFSGGVDSSLVAALVYQTFCGAHDHHGNVLAVIGVSPSLPESQLILARSIASKIGIHLKEVPTTEWLDSTYVENQGQACFVCKSHLYSSLQAVADTASSLATLHEGEKNIIMFNGTNANDIKDPTRLGLVAAKNFSVQSPLIHTTKDDIRIAAKHMNLPNWNYAASPCLRSRLALGVEATSDHLKAVSRAEDRIRVELNLDKTTNMRVRMFSGNRAVVELDEEWLTRYKRENGKKVEVFLRFQGVENYFKELGFVGGFEVRAFKSGSVSRAVA